MEAAAKRKKKRRKAGSKKAQLSSVENIYMREAIMALIHSQNNYFNPLKTKPKHLKKPKDQTSRSKFNGSHEGRSKSRLRKQNFIQYDDNTNHL